MAKQVRELRRPRVETTGTLSTGAERVTLYGVIGMGGGSAQALQDYIASAGDAVTCEPQRGEDHRCVLPNADDVAMVALRNGAAQARGDAPELYRAQEAAAQDERRGIWASLPPPPVELKNPAVLNTATLQVAGKIYRLDGIVGMSGQLARELQTYIRANGDSMMCQPREGPDAFLCLLADGTDIAQAALVNGAAKVTEDAPPAYRIQQNDAIANSRGIWATAQPDAQPLEIADRTPDMPGGYVLSPEETSIGIVFISDAPAVIIDDQPMFVIYGGDVLGWGYWGVGRRWYGLPSRCLPYMNRHFPRGISHRGYRPFYGAYHGGHGRYALGQGRYSGPGHFGGQNGPRYGGGHPGGSQFGSGQTGRGPGGGSQGGVPRAGGAPGRGPGGGNGIHPGLSPRQGGGGNYVRPGTSAGFQRNYAQQQQHHQQQRQFYAPGAGHNGGRFSGGGGGGGGRSFGGGGSRGGGGRGGGGGGGRHR